MNIKEYLDIRSISYRESGKEIITKCLLNNCDNDSRGREAHLYISSETDQYNCKKCGESGNIITLAEKLRDGGDSYLWDQRQKDKKPKNPRFSPKRLLCP